MNFRSTVAWVLTTAMIFASVAPVSAFHCEGGILGKLKAKKSSCASKCCQSASSCCAAPSCPAPDPAPSCPCEAPAPEPVSLPCCPCPSCEAPEPAPEPEPVALPCCPCPSCGTEVATEAVVEVAAEPVALPCCGGEGEIVSEGETMIEGETTIEGEMIIQGETIVEDIGYTVVDDSSSGEVIISEEIISNDAVETTEDSATTAESTEPEVADPGAGAAEAATDLLEDFAPDTSDGAIFKKGPKKMRLVFVRTNEMARSRQAAAAKVITATTTPKPTFRLKFTPGIKK